jgi:hypothetical protein
MFNEQTDMALIQTCKACGAYGLHYCTGEKPQAMIDIEDALKKHQTLNNVQLEQGKASEQLEGSLSVIGDKLAEALDNAYILGQLAMQESAAVWFETMQCDNNGKCFEAEKPIPTSAQRNADAIRALSIVEPK